MSAEVVPFKGYIWNPNLALSEIARRVAPPYDVIPEELENELKRDPHNITWVTLGDEGDKYATAARRMQDWIGKQEIVKDDSDCFYVYEQLFDMPDGSKKARTGFICLVHIEEYEKGVVLPHERTLPKAKSDRLDFLTATKAHTDYIFSLYNDPALTIDTILDASKSDGNLIMDITDYAGIRQRVWRITDEGDMRTIQETIRDKKLFIADGHHRYETCINYRNLRREAGEPSDGSQDFDYRLMTLVNMSNPGLVVFPTHRLVFGIDEDKITGLKDAISKYFTVKTFGTRDEMLDYVMNGPDHTIGLYDKVNNEHYTATLSNEDIMVAVVGDSPTATLDVSILHKLILEKGMGFTQEMTDMKTNLAYVKGTEATFEEMTKEKYQVACVLKATSVEEVMSVAGAGEKMPQKSTFFYPKVWDGLVMHMLK